MCFVLPINVIEPPKVNDKILVRELDLETEWKSYIDIHFTPNWGYGPDQEQKDFLKESIDEFRKFSKNGNALRFGAFLNDEIIAELGIYWDQGVLRFNNVGTHMNYRRLGACSTLVYEVSKSMLEKRDIKTLVMEADEDYHAAKIYESVGFSLKEKLYSVEWKSEKYQ